MIEFLKSRLKWQKNKFVIENGITKNTKKSPFDHIYFFFTTKNNARLFCTLNIISFQYPVEEMDPSEIDWENINSQLPYEHSEEAHAQRRF